MLGRYTIVPIPFWSKGRAAIVGDSAHAMPSTMAQGAGLAMANGVALAERVYDASDLAAALQRWESEERPVTEITQRWAVLYATVGNCWPEDLLDVRSQIVAEALSSHA